MEETKQEEKVEEVLTKIIEIGCPPGTPRPDVYLERALEGTGIVPINTLSRLFGDWTWDYTNEITDEVWVKHRETIYDRLVSYYNEGRIRYASVSN